MPPPSTPASAGAGFGPGGPARGGRPPRGWSSRLPDRETLDEWCERGVLGVVLAMMVFATFATGATKPWQFLVLLGLGLLLIGFWLVRVWIRQQHRLLFPPLAWFVLLFAGYAIWRYTWVDIEYVARMELLQILLYVVVFFAVLDNLSKQESMQIIVFTLIILGLLNSFYAIFQYYTDSQHVLWYDKPATYRGRASGTYICPNHLAGFLEMVLPVALALTITGRFKPLTKVFLGYAALVMLAGIGVTVSRGGYLATGASLLVFFVVLLWNRTFRIPALGILILLLVTGSFFGIRSWQAQKRFSDLVERNMRLKYWEPAVEIWKQNFWFGAGAGHYDWRFRPWRFWKLQGRPIYVHNDYLNTVTEYGTTGGAIVAGSLLALGWGVLRSWKYVRRANDIGSKPSNRSSLVLGCAIGVLAIAFHSVSDFNLHIPANALVAVSFMAILSSHIRHATERFWVNPGIAGRLAISVALLALAAYFCWNLSRLGPQTYWLAKHFSPLTFEQRVQVLQRAFDSEPMNGGVATELGEVLRKEAWKVKPGWEKQLREAIVWFEKGVALNKWNPFNYMNLGMCYHWLKEPRKATDLFDRALALDPKSYYMLAMYGWHKMQLRDWAGAQKYLKESYSYYWEDNPIATNYLAIVERRLAEQANSP